MKKLIFFAIAVVFIGSIIPLSSAFASSASISISGPKSVEAGKTYTYTITLSGSDVSSAMVTSISTSGVFSGSGSGFEIGSGGENTSGSKSVNVSVTVSSSASPGDTGTISVSGQFGYWNEDMTELYTGSISKSLTATVVEPTPTPEPSSTATSESSPTPKRSAMATTTAKATIQPSASATTEPTPSPTSEEPLEWPDVEEMIIEAQAGGVISVNMEGKTEIPITVLSQLKDSQGVLKIDFGDYTCTIDGSTLNELPEDLSTLDLSMSMVKDELLSQAAGGFDVYQLNFNYHGELPGIFSYTFYASENEPGDTLYLYYSYKQAGIIEGMQSAVVDADGYATFEIYHCSGYFVSDAIVEGAINNFPEEESLVQAETAGGTSTLTLIISLIITAIVAAAAGVFITMYIFKMGVFKKKEATIE